MGISGCKGVLVMVVGGTYVVLRSILKVDARTGLELSTEPNWAALVKVKEITPEWVYCGYKMENGTSRDIIFNKELAQVGSWAGTPTEKRIDGVPVRVYTTYSLLHI